MGSSNLPAEIAGEWIWETGGLDKVESYVFFRREFSLTETPSLAELWVAANTTYHLYINGRHFCRGPSAATSGGSYVSRFDITFCLEVGPNLIAAVAHNTHLTRYSCCRKPSGFWCQLNLDELPTVWSDGEWRVFRGQCFQENQPRVAPGGAFVESVDLRHYPADWQLVDADTTGWEPADYMVPVEPERFLAAPDIEPFSENVPFVNIVSRGELEQQRVVLNICFNRVTRQARGLYAGETCISCEAASQIPFKIYCDDPYYLYVNGRLIKKQGGNQQTNWTDPGWFTPRGYLQSDPVDPEAVLDLQEGWNSILFVQQVEKGSAGATLVIDTPIDTLKFVRSSDDFSLPGWNVIGPVKLAFDEVSPSLNTAGTEVHYYNFEPYDVAAHMTAYDVLNVDEAKGAAGPVELTKGRFVVFELERHMRGCPEFTVNGSAGDILDIFYGDLLHDGIVVPFANGRRNVISLHLSDLETLWHSVAAQGFHYIMIYARRAHDAISITNAGIRKVSFSFKNPGGFNSSDELLNSIWMTGAHTLDATYDYTYRDSGTGIDGQLLGNAMIQAIASNFLIGDFTLSAKGLREFAEAQLPTGEFRAMAPTDYAVRLHDHALLWPVWLQKHVLYTDEKALVEGFAANLKDLFDYFDSLVDPTLNVLGDPDMAVNEDIDIDVDGIDRCGISTALNALYCHSLLRGKWLFDYIGEEEEAETCLQRASNIAHKIRGLTWNAEKNLFADSWYRGSQGERCSLQTNILAIYAGIAHPDIQQEIFEKLLFDYAPFYETPEDVTLDNPYFKYFLLETAFNCNQREWGLDFMRYYWGSVPQEGATTWRSLCNQNAGNTGHGCHCTGAALSPNYFLIREVVGIRPVSPGARQVYFNPMLNATEWVQAQIPTKNGQIRVEWSFEAADRLEIVIDADYLLEVVPTLPPEMAKIVTFHVSESVSILAQDELDEPADQDTEEATKYS